jgi:predicted enzyme related to lactoylglutathione lyase
VTEFLGSRPALEVEDVAEELGFWRDRLGWEVYVTMGEPAVFAQLGAGAASVTLSRPMVAGASPSVSTLAAVYVEVDDVEGLHNRLGASGVKVTDPDTHPWGLRDFVATTPTGHQIAFGERVSS